ncbi:hypothetical protein ACP4OV_011886 [Aristida adscensionis]
MSRALAAGRMLARRRRPPPPPRRQLKDLPAPNGLASKIAKLSDAERAELSKHLDKMCVDLQSKLAQEVDAYMQRPTFSNDKGNVNRVLNFFKVPKGEHRAKLLFRSSLTILFGASCATGNWLANRCMQQYATEDEKTVNHAM